MTATYRTTVCAVQYARWRKVIDSIALDGGRPLAPVQVDMSIRDEAVRFVGEGYSTWPVVVVEAI